MTPAADLLARVLTAQDRRLLDLYDVRVTVDGPETLDAAAIADELRAMIAGIEPEPEAYLVTPRPSRHERRRAAALTRRRTA